MTSSVSSLAAQRLQERLRVAPFLEHLNQRRSDDSAGRVFANVGDVGCFANAETGTDRQLRYGRHVFKIIRQVIGQADRNNGEPATEPVTPAMLMGTIMHTLFDPGKLRLESGIPNDLMKLVTEKPPIKQLV